MCRRSITPPLFMLAVALSAHATDINGAWIFTGTSSLYGLQFTATGQISQSGSNVSGQLSISGSPCASSVSLTGTLTGSNFSASVTEGVQVVTFVGVTSADGNSGAGSYNAPAGGCLDGDFGTWSARRTSQPPPSGPMIAAITEAATYGTTVAENGYAAIFGSGLASGTSTGAPPYSTVLGGTEVLVCPSATPNTSCLPALVAYASPSQVNVVFGGISQMMPAVGATTLSVAVSVNGILDVASASGNATRTNFYTFYPQAFVEGYDCFDDSTGYYPNSLVSCGLTASKENSFQTVRAAVTDSLGRLLTSSNEATLGGYYSIWLTGLGVFTNGSPPASIGLILSQVPVNGRSTRTQITISPTYFGESSVYPGLDQINFQLPASIAAGFPCEMAHWDVALLVQEAAPGEVATSNPFYIPILVRPSDFACN